MIIDVELEEWSRSPVIRQRSADYRRWHTLEFSDAPAKLTERQGVFCRNLIRIAVALDNVEIPVDFELPGGRQLWLDHGCIKIAELAGFIEPLQNGLSGTVEFIRLTWRQPQSN